MQEVSLALSYSAIPLFSSHLIDFLLILGFHIKSTMECMLVSVLLCLINMTSEL